MDDDQVGDDRSARHRSIDIDTAEQPILGNDERPVTGDPHHRRRVGLVIVAIGALAIVGGAAFVLLSGGDDGPGTTGDVVASGGEPSGSEAGDGSDSEGTADIETETGEHNPAEGVLEGGDEADEAAAEESEPSTSGSEGSTEFDDTRDTEWGGFTQGSPEAVVATFYDAVQVGDCEQIVDLWSQRYAAELGATREEQVAACNDVFIFDEAPEVDPGSIQVVSETASAAVVSVELTAQGETMTAEMHLIMEDGWKIDLVGGAESS